MRCKATLHFLSFHNFLKVAAHHILLCVSLCKQVLSVLSYLPLCNGEGVYTLHLLVYKPSMFRVFSLLFVIYNTTSHSLSSISVLPILRMILSKAQLLFV